MHTRRAVLLLAAALLAAGCTTTGTPAKSPAPRADLSGQSLWHVIDEDGRTVRQLPDDDPTVTAVRKTVVLHSGVVDDRDHRTIEQSAQREFAFYSRDFAGELRSQQYEKKLSALFTDNGLATRQTGLAWYESTFPQDMTAAKVEMDTVITFTEADRPFLNASNLALDTPYTQHRTVSLAKTGGKWTIVAIQKGPLTPQKKAPTGSDRTRP
ncbi:hypothetical protein [Streptomyces globisporus]|uniref:hypothetical protein n=1 Tax=Streptomyces globisporus TaxID=1908 RepID=UPI0004CBDA15|nr:hypothetical protein [Streptomyces globisporus]